MVPHSHTSVFCDSTDDRREEGEELRLLSLILTVVILMKLTVLLVMTSLCHLLLKIWIFDDDLDFAAEFLTPLSS